MRNQLFSRWSVSNAVFLGLVLSALVACSSPVVPTPAPEPTPVAEALTAANILGTWTKSMTYQTTQSGELYNSSGSGSYVISADGSMSARSAVTAVKVSDGSAISTFNEIKGPYSCSGGNLIWANVQMRTATADFTDPTTGWLAVGNMTFTGFILGNKLFLGSVALKPSSNFVGLAGGWSATTEGATMTIVVTIALAADGSAQLSMYIFNTGTVQPATPNYSVTATWTAGEGNTATMTAFSPADSTILSQFGISGTSAIKIGRHGDWLVLGTSDSVDGNALIKQ